MGNFEASSPFVQYVPHPPGLVFTETMPPPPIFVEDFFILNCLTVRLWCLG